MIICLNEMCIRDRYKGFINPVYTPVQDSNGNITDVKISYDEGYSEQMLRYSKDYSPLPTYNDQKLINNNMENG